MKKTHEDIWGTGEDFIGLKAIGTNTGEGFKTLDELLEILKDEVNAEVGVNSNGVFVKYPDGRLKCYNTYLGTQLTTGNALGNIFQSNGIDWTFPFPFTQVPLIKVYARRVSGSTAWGGHSGGLSTTGVTALRILSATNNTVGIIQTEVEGRWEQ